MVIVESRRNPSALLQLLQRRPLIFPVLWQWSTDKCRVFCVLGSIVDSGFLQTAHRLFCFSKREINSSYDKLKSAFNLHFNDENLLLFLSTDRAL